MITKERIGELRELGDRDFDIKDDEVIELLDVYEAVMDLGSDVASDFDTCRAARMLSTMIARLVVLKLGVK